MVKTLDIWKLQRPLFTNGDYCEVLAYTYGKERQAFIRFTEKEIEQVFGDEVKVYVAATVKRGNLVIEDLVEEQDW